METTQPTQQHKNGCRTKYYFVSYLGVPFEGASQYGCLVFKCGYMSLMEMCNFISEVNGYSKPAVILNLRELTQEEFEMLNPPKDQKQ